MCIRKDPDFEFIMKVYTASAQLWLMNMLILNLRVFGTGKFSRGKDVDSVAPGKKKKDAKTLLIYSQGDKLDIVRGPTVRSHVSVPLSRWSDSHRYDKHQICNHLSQLRAAQHYGAYLYSVYV